MLVYYIFFCFKQKTAYEMRISDWSSDVCSSDLRTMPPASESSRNRFVFGNDGTVGTPATEITQASGCARLICSVSLKRLRNVSNSVRFAWASRSSALSWTPAWFASARCRCRSARESVRDLSSDERRGGKEGVMTG